jgi:hypothetical protein
VFSTAWMDDGSPTHLTTQYLYGRGGPALSCSSGALAQRSRPFVHGFEVYLEAATLSFESGVLPLTVYKANGETERPMLAGGDDPIQAFAAEIQSAADAVASGVEPDWLRATLARDALVMCRKEMESAASGNVVAIT